MKKTKNEREIKPDFRTMWKAFWNPDTVEKSQEEEILENEELTDEQKKELIKTLKSTEKIGSKMFRDSYKTVNLKDKNLAGSAKKAYKGLQEKETQTDKNKTKEFEHGD